MCPKILQLVSALAWSWVIGPISEESHRGTTVCACSVNRACLPRQKTDWWQSSREWSTRQRHDCHDGHQGCSEKTSRTSKQPWCCTASYRRRKERRLAKWRWCLRRGGYCEPYGDYWNDKGNVSECIRSCSWGSECRIRLSEQCKCARKKEGEGYKVIADCKTINQQSRVWTDKTKALDRPRLLPIVPYRFVIIKATYLRTDKRCTRSIHARPATRLTTVLKTWAKIASLTYVNRTRSSKSSSYLDFDVVPAWTNRPFNLWNYSWRSLSDQTHGRYRVR